MTNLPNDQLDPYESRLARHVGDFADQAVRPIDAAAIAGAARASARKRSLAGRLFGSTRVFARTGLILVGAIIAGTAVGMFLNAGGYGFDLGPNDTASSQTPVPGAAEPCSVRFLTGEITAWEGAAGHRIATILVHNDGPAACLLPQYLRPALVDSAGHNLIMGETAVESLPITLPNGADAASYVDMANSCGVAAAEPPYRIRLYLPSGDSFELSVAPSVPGPVDLPPCNGPTEPGQIHMQPLHLVSPRY